MACLRQAVVTCVLAFGGMDFSDYFSIPYLIVSGYLKDDSFYMCEIVQIRVVMHLRRRTAARKGV